MRYDCRWGIGAKSTVCVGLEEAAVVCGSVPPVDDRG
jgi:hypothetical protein